MRFHDAVDLLNAWDKRDRCVFTRHDLRLIFRDDAEEAFKSTLKSLVSKGQLVRAAHGVYVYPNAQCLASAYPGYLVGQIVDVLRAGHVNYVSLESLLWAYGLIAQSHSALTVVTEGNKGYFETIYGNLEFIHTSESRESIIANTRQDPKSPLRIATVKFAMRDMERFGRNVDIVDQDKLANLVGIQ